MDIPFEVEIDGKHYPCTYRYVGGLARLIAIKTPWGSAVGNADCYSMRASACALAQRLRSQFLEGALV